MHLNAQKVSLEKVTVIHGFTLNFAKHLVKILFSWCDLVSLPASLPCRWRGVQWLSPSLPDFQSSLPGGIQPQQRSQSGGRPQTLALQHQSESKTSRNSDEYLFRSVMRCIPKFVY